MVREALFTGSFTAAKDFTNVQTNYSLGRVDAS